MNDSIIISTNGQKIHFSRQQRIQTAQVYALQLHWDCLHEVELNYFLPDLKSSNEYTTVLIGFCDYFVLVTW